MCIFIIGLAISLVVTAQSKTNSSNWPKEINSQGLKILVYQPQPDSLIGIKLFARAAVSVSKGTGQPVFGAIWMMTTIAVDRTSRDVSLTSVKVQNVRFPDQVQSSSDQMALFKSILETEIPKWDLSLTMDELNASLTEAKAVMKQASGLKNDPPEIIFATSPSVLVLFDGDPVFRPVPDSKLQIAANTAFFIVHDPSDKSYFLYGNNWWYKTSDPVKGKWENIKSPPSEVKKLQESIEKQASQDNGQQASLTDDKSKTAPANPPQVIVRTAPAELVQSNGQPAFAPIEGTNLLYMTNSENNAFMYIDKQTYFILISGRWYTAKAMAGPWAFVPSDQLPADFAKIPEGSEKDQVLASVAGTDAAKDAVMDAQIPQTAAVDRKTATCKVTYDGDPKFVQIKGTLLYRAANTSSTVILSDKTYYVCENAVWFFGSAPTGPWAVATEIPAEIQNIPPEDPAYNVKYVYIYESTPEVVYVGYLPGYTGCYVYGPTVVYGTGFYYNPWYGPYYYPRPVTYGYCMTYNPWTGWGFGVSYSVGFVAVGFYAHPVGWWGPPMFRPPFCPPYNHFYGPRPPVYRNTYVNVNVNNYNYNRNNVYNNQPGARPGSGQASRPGQGGSGTRPTTQPGDRGQAGTRPSTQPSDRGQAGTRPSTQPSDRGQAGTARDQKNNVYTDRNGDVYRKDQNNNWQKNDGKNWNNVDQGGRTGGQPSTQPGRQDQGGRSDGQPSTRPQGQPTQQPANRGGGNQGFDRSSMDRQSQSRDRGQQMNQNRSSFQGGGGGSRGGGGGGRGGGGRR